MTGGGPANPSETPHGIACRFCSQTQIPRALAPGEAAYCGRCGGLLWRERQGAVAALLPLALAGLLLFGTICGLPLLGLRAGTTQLEVSLLDACLVFWRGDYALLSLLLLANLFALPLLELVTLCSVSLTVRRGWRPGPARALFRWSLELRRWAMLEVFMLGALVAMAKLGDLATLIIGPAFYSLCGLVVLLAAVHSTLDPETVWRALAREAKG